MACTHVKSRVFLCLCVCMALAADVGVEDPTGQAAPPPAKGAAVGFGRQNDVRESAGESASTLDSDGATCNLGLDAKAGDPGACARCKQTWWGHLWSSEKTVRGIKPGKLDCKLGGPGYFDEKMWMRADRFRAGNLTTSSGAHKYIGNFSHTHFNGGPKISGALKYADNTAATGCPDGIGPRFPWFYCLNISLYHAPENNMRYCTQACYSWTDNMARTGMMRCVEGPNIPLGLTKGQFLCQRALLTHVHTTPASWGLLVTKRVRCHNNHCVVFKVGLCIDVKTPMFQTDNVKHPPTLEEKQKFAVKAVPLLEAWTSQSTPTKFPQTCSGNAEALVLVNRQLAMS